MKTYVLKCPHCGGNLEVGEDREYIYCQFCGTKILMNSISKSELKIKTMEHIERMKDKELESDRMDNIVQIVVYCVVGLTMLGIFLAIILK